MPLGHFKTLVDPRTPLARACFVAACLTAAAIHGWIIAFYRSFHIRDFDVHREVDGGSFPASIWTMLSLHGAAAMCFSPLALTDRNRGLALRYAIAVICLFMTFALLLRTARAYFTANRLCRGLLGLKSEDSTAGFCCYRRKPLVALAQFDIRSNGYAFQVEMTYYSEWLESQVREVPITFEDRVQAKRTICRSEVMSAVSTVTRLWVHRLLSGGSEERKALASLTSSF